MTHVHRWAVVAVACLAWAVVGGGLALAAKNPFPSASDTYYRLDVPSGTMTARVETTIQNASGKDATVFVLYALPGATNLVVQRDGATLFSRTSTASGQAAIGAEKVLAVTVTMPFAVKPNAKVSFVMTYDVPAQKGDLLRLEPGAIETSFIGQGPGSFVFVDVLSSAQNYFDPGCLKLTDQPKDVKDAGYERWVCGDVTVIAMNGDNKEVLKRCAALDEACRQRESNSPFSAFVQSITDQSLLGRLDADVAMREGTKTLSFGYFRRDQAWADKQFAIAQQALPRLEAVFGFPYPGGGVISMRESHHIEQAGAAGIAFPTEGTVLITPGSGIDEEVTIHELAHQWAGDNLSEPWLWEGLAEYAMRIVAPSLGVTPSTLPWQSFGFKDPLTSWYNSSPVWLPEYWYGKAGAFWFAYRDAIGGAENLTAVLAMTSPHNARAPYDGRWFMDAGERLGHVNLDALYLGWVVNPETAAAGLKDRRVTYDALNAILARAAEMGLNGTPTDIFQNLDVWNFAAADAQLPKASSLLDTYAEVSRLTAEAGLPPGDGVAKSWGTQTMAATAGLIEQQRQAVKAIQDSLGQFANVPEGSAARKQLTDATAKFAAGEFAEAKRLAAASQNAAHNLAAAGQAIQRARQKQDTFKPGFIEKIGLTFKNPDADLARAEQAYAAGDGTVALSAAEAAYSGWDNATARGWTLLSVLAGLLCVAGVGAMFVARRRSREAERALAIARGGRTGHVIDASEAHSRWQDWEKYS